MKFRNISSSSIEAVSYTHLDVYKRQICAGVAAIFVVQATENIGMCMGLLPVIGVTLPFLSYGGSSVLSIFIGLGVAVSAMRRDMLQ